MIGSSSTLRQRGTGAVLASMLLVGLGAAPPTHAQIAVGAKGGVHLSNLSVTESGAAPAIPYETFTGPMAGVTVALDLMPWLVVQVEGRFAQHGTQLRDGDLTAAFHFSRLEIPLVAQVSAFGADAPVRPRLHAGGIARFETACGLHVSGTTTLDLDCAAAGLDQHETTDYGVVFGGGADVRLGPGAVMLDVEYALGLRQLADDPAVEASSRVFGITAGYRLAL